VRSRALIIQLLNLKIYSLCNFKEHIDESYFIGHIFEKREMKREFIETPSFTKRWFALGLNDDDLAELHQFLIKNPEAGDMMVGTGGLRKLRFAFGDKGKSGSPESVMSILQYLKKISASGIFKG